MKIPYLLKYKNIESMNVREELSFLRIMGIQSPDGSETYVGPAKTLKGETVVIVEGDYLAFSEWIKKIPLPDDIEIRRFVRERLEAMRSRLRKYYAEMDRQDKSKSRKRDTSKESSARFLASIEAKKKRSEQARERSHIRAAEIKQIVKRQPVVRYYENPGDKLRKAMKNFCNCIAESAALHVTEDRRWREKHDKKDKAG